MPGQWQLWRTAAVACFKWRDRARVTALAVILASFCGCSLVSFKSPERPLSARDMNTRILTREYSAHFVSAIERCADEITAGNVAANVQSSALRWKISATRQSLRAATQLAPQIGLLDTWAFAVQMKDFMSDTGPGGHLFGGSQDIVRTLADEQARGAEVLAKALIPLSPAHDRQEP